MTKKNLDAFIVLLSYFVDQLGCTNSSSKISILLFFRKYFHKIHPVRIGQAWPRPFQEGQSIRSLIGLLTSAYF